MKKKKKKIKQMEVMVICLSVVVTSSLFYDKNESSLLGEKLLGGN